MKRIGITGQSGFVGTHLAKYVMKREDVELVPFEDVFFSDETRLRSFVRECDVIVHLAAMSRCNNENELYATNVRLVQQVIDAMEAESVKPLVMFASSTHETRDTAYGRAKLEGRTRFAAWARRNYASFVGFIFPNIYGPDARVHYASFIANFAWELQHGEAPTIQVDALMSLKYIGNLCVFIGNHFDDTGISRLEVPHDLQLKVTDILTLFRLFKMMPDVACKILGMEDNNMRNLYNTFIAYRDV